jgi:Holliday junction DNA helicase RuvA
MIAYLTGRVLNKAADSVIIETHGIGYEVIVPLSTFYSLPEKEENVSLHIYTHVREDALNLFGFSTKLEKDLFQMLISVSGIGPKLSISILSGIGPRELLRAISREDAHRLQAIPGVGKKTASRLALELKDRADRMLENESLVVPAGGVKGPENIIDDALSALLNLGYPARQAEKVVKEAQARFGCQDLADLIRQALKALAEKK